MFGEGRRTLPLDACEKPRHPERYMVLKEPMDGGTGLYKAISLSGGYVCSKTGGQSHGINGMRMWFVVGGPPGAIQWLIDTSWYPRSTPAEPGMDWLAQKLDPKLQKLFDIMGPPPKVWDLGYHSRRPMYDDQSIHQESCDWLDGAPCYYDGSSLNGERFLQDFLTHPGSIWRVLWKEYEETFEHGNPPSLRKLARRAIDLGEE